MHGYILFGQKPASAVRELLDTGPEDLKQKKFIGFATYLFFPAGALNYVKNIITKHNGKYLISFARSRSKKQTLVNELTKYIENIHPPT